MQVVIVKDPEILNFLLHVFQTYTEGGIPPAQLAIAAESYAALKNAVEVPAETESLGNARITDISPEGLTLEIEK